MRSASNRGIFAVSNRSMHMRVQTRHDQDFNFLVKEQYVCFDLITLDLISVTAVAILLEIGNEECRTKKNERT